MTRDPATFELDIEELLQHDAWLRSLVGSIVSDDTASDVLQQTWLSAIRNPPRDSGALRSWLSRVAKHRAFATRRNEARRKRHELAARPPSMAESAEESLLRIEAQRSVTQAVLELPEPYRTAVVLRYERQLSIDEIADRTDTSTANARQRVKRGLDQLRERLAGEFGADWRRHRGLMLLAAPAPLAAGPGLSMLFGALTMTKARVLAVFALLAVVGWVGWQTFGADPSGAGPPPQNGESMSAGSEPAVVTATPPEARGESRRALPNKDLAAGRAMRRGRVLDLRGQPVGGARIVLRHEVRGTRDELATTADDGTFEIPAATDGERRLLELAGAWTAVHTSRLPHPADHELLIVAAEPLDLSGTVMQPNGLPVPDVRVRVQLRPPVDFPMSLEQTVRPGRGGTTTDDNGRFRLSALPVGAAQLVFDKRGFERARLAIEPTTATRVEVRLEAIDEDTRIVTGTVRDHLGTPMPNASVGLGSRRATTDEFGDYRIELAPGEEPSATAPLWAARAGLRTVAVPDFGAVVAAAERGLVERDLQFEGPALSITGRVLDVDGEAIDGVYVFPWGETPLFGTRIAEDLAAPPDTEPLELGGPSPLAFAYTDDEGRFELGGLGNHEYRLRVLDREAGWGFTSEPIRAGATGVDVRLPLPTYREVVTGRTVTPDGNPAPGVRIEQMYRVWETPFSTNWQSSPREVRTGADGTFEIEGLPRFGVDLRFRGDDYIDERLTLAPRDVGTDLEVVVARRCMFRLTVSDPTLADAHIRVFDASGRLLRIHHKRRGVSGSASSHTLQDGKTHVLATSEHAATIEVVKGERSLRIPVRLQYGQINTIAR